MAKKKSQKMDSSEAVRMFRDAWRDLFESWFSDSGLTQGDLSKALRISQPTISNYFRGERFPSIDTLFRIRELSGTTFFAEALEKIG